MMIPRWIIALVLLLPAGLTFTVAYLVYGSPYKSLIATLVALPLIAIFLAFVGMMRE